MFLWEFAIVPYIIQFAIHVANQRFCCILDFIKDNYSTGRNDSGEFVYDERTIPEYNIKDPITAPVRNTKKSRGWSEFRKSFQAGSWVQTAFDLSSFSWTTTRTANRFRKIFSISNITTPTTFRPVTRVGEDPPNFFRPP